MNKTKYNNVDQTEKLISKLFNIKHCILTGRATSAFNALFEVFFKKNDHIMFPAIICPQPVLAAKLTNLVPVIVDVEKDNGLINVKKVADILKNNKNIKAIVYVELFGQQNKNIIDELVLLSKKYKVFLIRDCAQSLPITVVECDFTILSFGHTKILDCGHGGAILSNNEDYSNFIREKTKQYSEFDNNAYLKKTLLYRRDFYSIKAKNLDKNKEKNQLNKLLLNNNKSFSIKFCNQFLTKIENKVMKINNSIDRRRNLSSIYYDILINKNVQIITDYYIDIPWRFSILLQSNDKQKIITSKLRHNNYHASNWYDSVMIYFKSNEIITYDNLENSYFFAQRILNLWVDESITIEYTHECGNFLTKIFDKEA